MCETKPEICCKIEELDSCRVVAI